MCVYGNMVSGTGRFTHDSKKYYPISSESQWVFSKGYRIADRKRIRAGHKGLVVLQHYNRGGKDPI